MSKSGNTYSFDELIEKRARSCAFRRAFHGMSNMDYATCPCAFNSPQCKTCEDYIPRYVNMKPHEYMLIMTAMDGEARHSLSNSKRYRAEIAAMEIKKEQDRKDLITGNIIGVLFVLGLIAGALWLMWFLLWGVRL